MFFQNENTNDFSQLSFLDEILTTTTLSDTENSDEDVDIFSVSDFAENCVLDLQSGNFSTVTFLTETLPKWSLDTDEMAVSNEDIGNQTLDFNAVLGDALGDSGNNIFVNDQASNTIDGGAGLDFLISSGILDENIIRQIDTEINTETSFELQQVNGEIDSLISIERLIFEDKGLALDLDGAAGQVAKTLGAVLGAESVENTEYTKIGLDLLDSGMSYDELMTAVIKAAGATDNDQVVDLLWTNLIGSHPTAEQAQPYVQQLNDGLSVGELGTAVADSDLNMANIDFLGLSQTGLAFDIDA